MFVDNCLIEGCCPLIVTTSLTGLSLPRGSTCVALGLFDGLHLGHRAVLDAMLGSAAELSLEPAVFTFETGRGAPEGKDGMTRLLGAVGMDRMLREMRVLRVVRPEFEEFRNLTPEDFVKVLAERVGAARVICGYDFRFGKNAAGDSALLSKICGGLGVSAVIVPKLALDGEEISSRRIRGLIKEGKIPEANRLLGYPFFIDFEVVAGRRLGRTLGWPTINQPFPGGYTLPRFGVYATVTEMDGRLYGSVTNVGVKPTVGSDRALAETYIQGYSGDLYNRSVTVRFLSFLRPEQKFDDLSALRGQISSDALSASRVAEEYIISASRIYL